MSSAVRNIVATAVRKPNDNRNFIMMVYDGAFGTMICNTNFNFYSSSKAITGRWDLHSFPQPPNLYLFEDADLKLPNYLDCAGIIAHNRDTQYINALQLSRQLHIPFILVEHCVPDPALRPEDILQVVEVNKPDLVIYPHQLMQDGWGAEGVIIPYNIPPPNMQEKDIDILIAGQFLPDDINLIQDIKDQLGTYNVVAIGDNPPATLPAKSYNDYLNHFARAKIFLNLNAGYHIPFELLYAMINKCAILFNPNKVVQTIIGEAGKRCASVPEFIDNCQILMRAKTLRKELANKGFDQIGKYLTNGINQWQTTLSEITEKTYVRNDAY